MHPVAQAVLKRGRAELATIRVMATKRTDEQGRAYKKSQLQAQLWVNRRRAALTAEVLKALPSLAALDPHLTWVSPIEK